MSTPTALREQIAAFVVSGDAHQAIDSALDEVPVDARGKRPGGAPHSAWELLEHMRLAQKDILEYSRGDASYVALDFPSGYWPATPAPPTDSAWDESVAKFRADRDTLVSIVNDESFDLFAKLPHSSANWLAQLLLIADHNTYHLGQLVMVRRMLEEK